MEGYTVDIASEGPRAIVCTNPPEDGSVDAGRQIHTVRLALIRLYKEFPIRLTQSISSLQSEVKSALRSVRERLPLVWQRYKSAGKPQLLVFRTQAHSLLAVNLAKPTVKALIFELTTVIECMKVKEKNEEERRDGKENEKKRPWDVANLKEIVGNAEGTDVQVKRRLKTQLQTAADKMFRADL